MYTIALFILMLSLVSCRDEEPEPTIELDPIAPELVDAACVALTACSPAGSDTPGECATSTLTRPASEFRFEIETAECLARAGADCEAVDACVAQLEGDIDEEACAEAQSGTVCSDDVVYGCFAGEIDYVTDCAGWGLSCAAPYDDWLCQGEGASCTPGADDRCEGNQAVLCLGIREARFDCGDMIEGSRCAVTSGRAECRPQEPECDAASEPGRCEGDTLHFCGAAGVITSVDCVALGFTGCIEELDRARCEPAG